VSACEQAPAATYAPTAGYRLGNGGKSPLMTGKNGLMGLKINPSGKWYIVNGKW